MAAFIFKDGFQKSPPPIPPGRTGKRNTHLQKSYNKWVYREIFKLDVPAFNGDDSRTLPMPSRFIVDQNGVIRTADVNLDHPVRPEPDTAIEVLKGLKR